MAHSEEMMKALFDNPEFLTKFQSLVKEQVSKSKLTDDVVENGGTDAKIEKEQPLASPVKRPYKRRKILNQPDTKQNGSVEDIKSLLQDEDVKKKIVPCISECMLAPDNPENSSDGKLEKNTEQDTKINSTTDDVSKSTEEEVVFPNHNAAVMKTPTKLININKIKEKPAKQYIINLDKKPLDGIKIASNKFPLGTDVVNQVLNSCTDRKNPLLFIPVQSINHRLILSDKIDPTNGRISLEQPTDLNNQKNGENCEMSQSDDIYYLSMANSLTSATDTPEVPQVKNTTSSIFHVSNINNSIAKCEPNILTAEAVRKALKPVVTRKVIRRSFTIPASNQVNEIKVASVGSVIAREIPSYQTITVMTEKGEQSIKILQPSTKNLTEIKRTPGGSKPFIKSNVKLQGRIIKRLNRSDINDSAVSDISVNSLINADPVSSMKMPKIESVISMAESLPKITHVTSCATSVSDIESIVMHAPKVPDDEDAIPLAERLASRLKNEKILKIKRRWPKGRGIRKLQHKIVDEVKMIDSEVENNSVSFSSNASIDDTIEEVIAAGMNGMLDTNSDILDENKSEEDVALHINGLSVRNSQRKGLKRVMLPVKRVEHVNGDLQSDIGNVSIETVASDDRSGLPSIQNVVSLANSHISDDCLEEANQILSNSNGIYSVNNKEKHLKILKIDDHADSDDDAGFKVPTELFNRIDDEMQSENDDFNFAVDSLIEDISKKKFNKKSPMKNKSSSPFPKRQYGRPNGRGGLRVTKPVIRRQKRGRHKAIFGRRKLRAVEDNVEKSTDDVDLMGINFADLNLVDTASSFVNSDYNNSSFDQSTPMKTDNLNNKLSPMKSLQKDYDIAINNTNNINKKGIEHSVSHEPLDINETAVQDISAIPTEECEELLEEVPLQQRRCNNFYVKVPTGEELGNHVDIAEYEKFFSIQDGNNPMKKIQKVEIESLDNDDDLQASPSKRRTKCSKCDKTFVSSVMCKIHEATCENNYVQSSECTKCGRYFASVASRKNHEKKCQVVYGTVEVPVQPLKEVLTCTACPYYTTYKPAYIRHLKSHMYYHKKTSTVSARAAALRRKFGYRRKRRRYRFAAPKNRCELCNDDAGGVEHMVSRCRRCGAFNLQWCDECNKGGYSSACRLRHHEAECTATPHTRCSDVPCVRIERLGPPLPLHCVNCDVTRILYIREKHCKQCSSQLLFKCEMCAELMDTFAELVGHVARVHIYGCFVQCEDCGMNCEDLSLHREVCEAGQHEDKENEVSTDSVHFSEEDESYENEEYPSLENIILELEEDSEENSDGDQEQRIEEV